MSLHLGRHLIPVRLAILLLAIIELALAGLNSATVRFATILRDQAKSDLVKPADTLAARLFSSAMQDVVTLGWISAVCMAAFAICGAVLAAHSRWVQHRDAIWVFEGFQVLLALGTVIVGGYLADHVHGFRTSFDKFGGGSDMPYYSIMYYGYVAQATYGAAVIFLAIASSLIFCVFHTSGRTWSSGSGAAHRFGSQTDCEAI